MNSRYYDPQLGRFINSDDVSILSESSNFTNGQNLYSYCSNNPINLSDDCGHAWWHWLIGALVVIALAVATVVTAGGFTAAAAAMVGVMSGMGASSLGLSILAVAMTLLGAGLGFISSVGDNLIQGSDFGDWRTWLDIGISTSIGALFGFLGGSGATNAKALDSAVRNSSSFIKASSSYSKVLTKIAMGSYKNLAGAAGARFLTVTTLQTTWQAIVKNTIIKGLGRA